MSLPTEQYSRIERYLAKIAGQDVDIPDKPITRIECYLDYIVNNGGGGGGGGFTPAPNAGAHNGIFRGQSLGNEFTAEQSAAIVGGTFEDLYIGDYWTIGGVVYRIAGFDLFYRYGDTELTAHHAVMVPDKSLSNSQANDSETTAGGYAGSLLKSNLGAVLADIKTAFGASHVLEYRILLCNLVTDGIPSGSAWESSQIDVMTEGQVFGRGAFGTQTQNGFNVGISFNQFPLFALSPSYILSSPRDNYWLQDIRNATAFSNVALSGRVYSYSASAPRGIRPFFLIA